MKFIKKKKYGFLGLLSLLGFIGLFTGEYWYLCFFFCAIDFRYFFINQDEFFEEQMKKAASTAFFSSLFIFIANTLLYWLTQGVNIELDNSGKLGFVSSIIIFTLLTFYYEQLEKRVNDNEDRK